MEGKENWGIFYKGKVISMSDETIRWIKQDPTKVWGWLEKDLMVVWKNLFPLTERSNLFGYLPLKDEAWITTLNPWWRLLTDWLAILVPPMIISGPSAIGSDMQNLEKNLSEVEAKWTEPVISIRKILNTNPVECLLMGTLHRVKHIQFAEPKISVMILAKATQEAWG